MNKNKHKKSAADLNGAHAASDGDRHFVHDGKIFLEKNHHSYLSAFNFFLKRRFKKVIFLRKPFKVLIKVMEVFFVIIGIFIVLLFLIFGGGLPDLKQIKNINFAETTRLYDRNGNQLYQIFGKENRKYISLNDIDKKIIKATIATEDKNYYLHFGFDPIGIVRAQIKNSQSDGIAQGASTITQQLAKNIFLSPERTYVRKIKELLLAFELEWIYSKDEILEMYLNKIAYGTNAFGVEAAAQTFFGKPAGNVSLAQASILAALPKAPSYYSPYGPHVKELIGYCDKGQDANYVCTSPQDSHYVWGRKDYVLQRLLEDGQITQNDFLNAWQDSLKITFVKPKIKIEDPHFVFYVKDFLEQRYGKELVENGGLQVTTSIDPQLQAIAEKAVEDQAKTNLRMGANNAAFVALNPKNGQILAMVGSRDYWDESFDGQVNVVLSPRQPGSSFKPLVYATAVQNAGIGSGTYLDDSKTLFNHKDVPQDYDGKYLGPMTIRQALGGSRNIPAIKAFYVAGGEDQLLVFAEKLGIKSLRSYKDNFNKDLQHGWTFNYGWPMAIGSGEVSLLEMVGAYGVFANQGKYAPPIPVLEVRDHDGNLIEKFDSPNTGVQVIDPQIAYIISNMLADVWARPAGSWRNLLTIAGQNVAAKTGTSNKVVYGVSVPNNDLTIGYTPSLAAGVWVGNSDGSNMRSNAYSLYTTDPIFHKFFTEALKDKPKEDFPVPAGIKLVGKEVYPSWGAPKKYFENMFVKIEEKPPETQQTQAGGTQQAVPGGTQAPDGIPVVTQMPQGAAQQITPPAQ
ncbi:MAG: transglycosylase domain-containing protein [Candidatus Gracilibacteria bacterium]|jgi:membrane peptidoglycan carboxypeptidase